MAKITVAELKAEGRFTSGEFDWDNWSDATNVDAWLGQIVARASIRVQQAVGAGNYASTDTVTAGALEEAELAMAMALCLRRVIRILASRPEEAPPPAYVDLDAVRELMATYEADFAELTGAYRVTTETTPGLAFGFTSTGVDETETDVDYGTLGA